MRTLFTILQLFCKFKIILKYKGYLEENYLINKKLSRYEGEKEYKSMLILLSGLGGYGARTIYMWVHPICCTKKISASTSSFSLTTL